MMFSEIDFDSFAHYRYRFTMPDTEWPIPLNKMWYSIDIGPVHFVRWVLNESWIIILIPDVINDILKGS